MSSALTIGKLAAAAGVNIETIRYYQRRGLLDVPVKPLGAYRRYATTQVKRLRFIKRAQELGFTLSEIDSLLHLDSAHTCADTQELAERKLVLIKQRMTDLAAMKKVLTGLVQQCRTADGKANCPIINTLTQD